MIRQEIGFVTSNPVKLRIARRILSRYGISVRKVGLELSELQSFDVKEVALDKARQAMNYTKKIFMVSDDGFYIHALNGFPGALLKHIQAKLSDEQLLKLIGNVKGSRVEFVNVIVFVDPKSRLVKTFSTVTKGRIASKPSGSRKAGLGIERIFIPEGLTKPIAQLNEVAWKAFWVNYEKRLHYSKLGSWLQRRYRK